MRMIEGLLEEKACELEPSWEAACAIANEIETLHALEAAVAERVIAMCADSIDAVRGKLSIWRTLGAGSDDSDERSPRNRLILSVDADLERMARAADRPSGGGGAQVQVAAKALSPEPVRPAAPA